MGKKTNPYALTRSYIEDIKKEQNKKFLADVEKLDEKRKAEKMLDTMRKAFGELQNATPRSEGVCWIPEEYIPMLEAELNKRYNKNEVK